MCIGIAAAATAALTIGSTVAGYAGQLQQARAQQAYQSRMAEASQRQVQDNARLARDAYFSNLRQSNIAAAQQGAAASQKAIEVRREAARRGAAQDLSALESNVTGLSIDHLRSEFDRTEAEWTSTMERQMGFYAQQTQAERQAMQIQAEGRTQAVKPYIPQPVIPPSPFSLALGLGGAGLTTYDRYQFYNGKGPYAP